MRGATRFQIIPPQEEENMSDNQNEEAANKSEAVKTEPTVGQRIEAIAEEIGADAHKLVDEFERWLEKETEGSYKSKAPAKDEGTVAVSEKGGSGSDDSGSAMQSQVDESQKPDPNSEAQNGAAGTSVVEEAP